MLAASVFAARPWSWDGGWAFLQRDAGFNLVALTHLQRVFTDGGDWRATPLGWPLANATALTDWMAGEALLGLPLRHLGTDPARVQTLLVLAGLSVSALAFQRLAAALLGEGPHTWIAGVLGGLGAVQLAHAQHVNLVHHEWVALAALALGGGLARDRPAWAFAGGACALGAAHFGAYIGMHACFVAGMVVVAAGAARVGSRRTWLAAAAGAAAAGLTVLPVAGLYHDFAAVHGIRTDRGELMRESWDPRVSFAPLSGSPLHAFLGARGPGTGDPPNPGYLALILAGVGAWKWRDGARWTRFAVVGSGIGAALLALGPVVQWGGPTSIPGPGALLDAFMLRGPSRWLVVTHAAIGIFAAAGLRALVPPRFAAACGGLAVVVALMELPRTQAGRLAEIELEPAQASIGADPGVGAKPAVGALYENVTQRCAHVGEKRLRAALFHGRPLLGGQYARSFPAIQELNRLAGSWPSPEALALFRAVGVAVTLEHPPLRALPAGDLDCTVTNQHRVCTLPTRRPLPAPEAVSESGAGPVVGLRWTGSLGLLDLQIRCGDAEELAPAKVWALITRLREGVAVAHTDVFLETPCDGAPTASLAGARALFDSR